MVGEITDCDFIFRIVFSNQDRSTKSIHGKCFFLYFAFRTLFIHLEYFEFYYLRQYRRGRYHKYIAIHVQPNRENWVMTRFKQVLETTGMSRQIILHRLERTVVKLVGGRLRGTKESILCKYLLAKSISGPSSEICRLLSRISSEL